MVNSITIANEFASMVPADEVPEKTSGYEGFYHLIELNGTVENTSMQYIIRDFFDDTFIKRQEKLKEIEKTLNNKYGEGTVTVDIKEQYRNMKEMVEPVMHIVDNAKKAMEEADVIPEIRPIRGGTDGSRLSYMGLPTPNMFTGGENFHGKYEYIAIESMEKAVQVVVNIVKNYAK